MKNYLVLATTLLAAGLSIHPAYAATDWKTYSGIVCQPIGTTTAADLTVSGFGVTNKSAITQRVICPLVQDHEDGWGAATNIAQIYLGHSAGAIPGTVDCTFYYGTTGVGFVTKHVALTIPANTSQAGAASVTFDSAPVGGYPGYAIAAYCSVSSKATVNAFWISESGATNIP